MGHDPAEIETRLARCERTLFGDDDSAAANVITGAGYRDSAADVDTVQLFFSSGNFGGGKIRLFGWSE